MPRSAAMFGVVSTRWPPGFRMRLISLIRCMGSSNRCSISSQQSTVEKYSSGYGKRSFSASKWSMSQAKVSPSAEVTAAMVDAAQLAVVAAAHLAVAQLAVQRRRDLQIRAHFQNAVVGAARRRDFERLHQARLVSVQIPARTASLTAQPSQIARPGAAGRAVSAAGAAALAGGAAAASGAAHSLPARITAFQKAGILRAPRSPSCTPGHVVPRALAQRAAPLPGRDTSRFRYSKIRSSSPAPTGTFRQTSSGNSAKRPDLGNHHRLAQPQRAQQRAGTFADRGVAQIEHDVAGAQVAHEILDGREAQHAHVGRKPHASGSSARSEIRDAARPPESCWRSAPGAPGGGTRAAIRRCACTASGSRRCRSAEWSRRAPACGARRCGRPRGIHAPCGITADRAGESGGAHFRPP